MSPGAMSVRRATPADHPVLLRLLQDYAAAIGLLEPDTPEQVAAALAGTEEAAWLGFVGGEPAGCVRLRPLSLPGHAAAECKRLFVAPQARGLGLADALMDALEQHARDTGFRWLYLDSKDDLQAALRLYRRRGYTDCSRYNGNPQATVFLRKALGGA